MRRFQIGYFDWELLQDTDKGSIPVWIEFREFHRWNTIIAFFTNDDIPKECVGLIISKILTVAIYLQRYLGSQAYDNLYIKYLLFAIDEEDLDEKTLETGLMKFWKFRGRTNLAKVKFRPKLELEEVIGRVLASKL